MQVVENRIRERQYSLLNPFALLATPDPPCVLHPKMLHLPDSEYSTVNCIMECAAILRPVKNCNCVPYFRNEHYRTCEVEEIWRCQSSYGLENDPITAMSLSDNDLNNMHECMKRCQIPCFDRSIESQISVTTAPSEQQLPELEKWLKERNFDSVRVKDLIVLDIYFSKLSIKLVEQYEAMSLDNLISSSGGVIGIWAGMSFLTVFQAVAFLIRYIEHRWKAKAQISQKTKISLKTKRSNSAKC